MNKKVMFDDMCGGLFENDSENNRKSGISNEIQLPNPATTIDFSFANYVAQSERSSYESRKRDAKF